MTERLHFHFLLSCIGEGNGNPLQCSCLENPRDGGAWWAAVYGVSQSWTRLKWLSSITAEALHYTITSTTEQAQLYIVLTVAWFHSLADWVLARDEIIFTEKNVDGLQPFTTWAGNFKRNMINTLPHSFQATCRLNNITSVYESKDLLYGFCILSSCFLLS